MHIKIDADINSESPVQSLDLEIEEIPGLLEFPGLEGCTDIAAISEATDKLFLSVLRGEVPAGLEDAVLASTKSAGRSTRITIRVPTPLLAKLKEKASSLGIGYQTLMIQKLTEAVKGE